MVNLVSLFKETVAQWRKDDTARLGTALAYYAAFSLMPLLLISTVLAGTIFGEKQVEHELVQRINTFVGPQTASVIRDALQKFNGNASTNISTLVLSTIALLFGATGMFRNMKNALNTVWHCSNPETSRMRGFLRDTLLSFLMVAGAGILLFLALIFNAVMYILIRSLDESAWNLLAAVVFFLVVTLIFAVIYRVLPDAHVQWHDVWIGAVVTSLLFGAGQIILSVLLSQTTIASAYGAASALLLILIWVYISAQIFLFGAELTQAYANRFGSKIIPVKEM